MKRTAIFLALSMLPGSAVPAMAQDADSPDPEILKDLYPGKTYSPHAQRSFPSQVYWGETHLHTGVSLDAGMFGMVGATNSHTGLTTATETFPFGG